MDRLPLAVTTLYADLLQRTAGPAPRAATISRRSINGVRYVYALESVGAQRVQRFLGREGDDAVEEEVHQIRRQARIAAAGRKTVTMLKAAGIPAPSREIGRVLDAVAYAGLFEAGLVLVGTIAFQCYPCLVGARLDHAAMATQDADLVAASVAAPAAALVKEKQDFAAILRRADATFSAVPTLDPSAAPARFRSAAGLDVELLTPIRNRRDEEGGAVPLPGLGASAIPLRFLEYLVEAAVPAVALHGAGTRIRVPQPARFAIHKLIVADRRGPGNPKREKDLRQAASLIASLDETEVSDALGAARSKGPAWRSHIARSLAALEARPLSAG